MTTRSDYVESAYKSLDKALTELSGMRMNKAFPETCRQSSIEASELIRSAMNEITASTVAPE